MEATKLWAQVREAAACKKKENAKGKEGASSSTPKAVCKGATKRKGDGKDDCLSKKVSVTPGEKLPKKPSPPKPKHGVSKGLMTTFGPVTQDPQRRFLTHKDYALEMMETIIRDKDVDLCAEETMEELGVLGLFYLARVRFFLCFSIYSFLCLIVDSYPVLQVLVHMKALQDRGVAKEGVITRLHKRIKNLTDGQEQYKSALRTLNQEVMELKGKLEEEGRQKRKE